MSLLPSLFRQTDIPMQLGAKVERPAPKKPDPIKEFETGMHDPDGTAYRYVWRSFDAEMQKTRGAHHPSKPVEMMQRIISAPAKAFTLQPGKGTPAALAGDRTVLMQDFKTLSGLYASRGLDFNPFEIRKAAGVAIDARPTNEQLSRMIDHMLDVLYGPPSFPSVKKTR